MANHPYFHFSQFDFSGYSLEQLRQLQCAVANQRMAVETQLQKQIRQQVRALLERYGLTMGQVFPELFPDSNKTAPPAKKVVKKTAQKATSPQGPAPIRFEHPEHHHCCWTGLGRQPLWLRQFLQQGGTLSECWVAPYCRISQSPHWRT